MPKNKQRKTKPKAGAKPALRGLAGACLITILLIWAGTVLTFVLDTHTTGIQREMSLNQLNGGDADWANMRTTNSALGAARNIVAPVVMVLAGWTWGVWIRRNKDVLFGE